MRNKDLENAWEVQWIRQEKCAKLEEENKKLKEENEYRKKIADVLPEWEWHIAEETIQDLQKEIKKLKEDVDYFRQCYLDLKKLCEKEWFMLSDEEVTKMFNLDKIK